MSIHDKVKAVRKKLGLSQTAFGERLGVGIGVIKMLKYLCAVIDLEIG